MSDEMLKLAEEYFGKPFEYYTGYDFPQLDVSFEFRDEDEAIEIEMRLRMLMEATGKDRNEVVWEAIERGIKKTLEELEAGGVQGEVQ